VFNGVVKADLKGTLRFDWKPDGLACEMIIPLDQLGCSLNP
jgi:hypothetical protein